MCRIKLILRYARRVFVLVSPLIVIAGGAIQAQEKRAVDSIRIDDSRDPRFLPYWVSTELDSGGISPCSRASYHLARVVEPMLSGSDSALILVASNGDESTDSRTTVNINSLPHKLAVRELPNRLTVTDLGTYREGSSTHRSVWYAGYRNDSAWIYTLPTVHGQTESLFVGTGKDRSGNGRWECQILEIGSFDCDGDGLDEQLFYLNAEIDFSPRTILCVKLAEHRIMWQVQMASTVPAGNVALCKGADGPEVIGTSYGPGQGAVDSGGSDAYGYLFRIDRNGTMVSREVVARYGEGTAILSLGGDRGFIMLHSLAPAIRPDPADTLARPSMISCLDAAGDVVRSITLPERISTIWLGDYNRDGRVELYSNSFTGVFRIYTLDLELLAESDKSQLRYMGEISDWSGLGQAFFYSENGKSAVYTPQFEKLAVTPVHGNREALGVDSLSHVIAFLAGGEREHFAARIHRRSIINLATTVYVDNQKWVLAALSSLLVGLIITNTYRKRISRQNKELASAHRDLVSTHDALKEAQAIIVSQAKFRQAKDIAGGFAHEIRNALLPADAALTRLRMVGDLKAVAPEEIAHLHTETRSAVHRAIDITRQISHYTRLESDYNPAPVCLRRVVDAVLQSNRLGLDAGGVEVQVRGEAEVEATANVNQLYSVFNNLLLNSLDALTNRTNPSIIIEWMAANGSVDILFSDNGLGISSEAQVRIFDAFYSTKPSTGTGLGLAVAKRVVEMYGGSISASSRIGKGTTFTIRLIQVTTDQSKL